MTREELLALPVVVDVVTAGRAFSLGRNKTYDLIHAGEFPVPVHDYRGAKRVVTADLWRALGVTPHNCVSRTTSAAVVTEQG